jgi:conjugative relaxase-like TrwC/TraI family protein
MLSIGRLGVATGAEYYLETVANSVDDYYLGHGEAPGRWIGATAEQLGLRGEVNADQLRNLLAGFSPGGDPLGIQLRTDRRPGYDLTFSAPKGVSLLWAFSSDQIRGEITEAHDRAVVAVLDQLGKEASFARRGASGQTLIEAKGFIGAAFRHRTSRALDPQLHTHVVVPNLVQGADGRWSAPDGRHLYAWKKTAGTLYQSALRSELAPLGLAWEVRRNGLSELADLRKPILRAFSKRRVEIEAAMETRGVTSAQAGERAALATRATKPVGVLPTDLLREEWTAQLAQIQLPAGQGGTRSALPRDLIMETVGNFRPLPPQPNQLEAVFSILAGEARVSLDDWELDERVILEHGGAGNRVMPLALLSSTFARREAMAALARAFDVTPDEAAALTDQFLERSSIVRVRAEPETGRDAEMDYERMRTTNGAPVRVTIGDQRFTTTELLAAEERIVETATRLTRVHMATVAPGLVAEVAEHHPHLDGEQLDGVRKLLTSGNGVDLVIGQAGTGKSTMLRAARVGWEAAGMKVIGAAVAARTAADLEAGTGIPSSSLAQILADLKRGGELTNKHVIVVDEASLVGTRALDELCNRASSAWAKVVLVGDNRQISSIDAGGALRTLANEMGDHVVTLTTNRRQAGDDQAWEREALAALRDGEISPAVQAYLEHGRVTLAGTIDEARQRLIDDWWAVHRDHTTAIMAVRRVDVATLNELARARRQAGGELGRELVMGEKAFSVGDRVIFERNQRVQGADEHNRVAREETVRIRNGTFATVVGVVDPAGERELVDARTREGDVALGRGIDQGDVARGRGTDQGDVAHQDRAAQGDVARAVGLVVTLDDGRRVVLPVEYVSTSTSLGYALTVFRSQGITVDHAFGLAGAGLSQEAGYTQLSRGRLSNNLYVASSDNPRWEIGHYAEDRALRDQMDELRTSLSHSEEQRMARDNLPSWPTIDPDQLDAAYRQFDQLGRALTTTAPIGVLQELLEHRRLEQEAEQAGRVDGEVRKETGQLALLHAYRQVWITEHREDFNTWARLDDALRRHEYRLGQAAAYSRPEHVTSLLGPVPTSPTDTERWQTAAGAIEAYRSRWEITGEQTLGPEPTGPEQRSHWSRTVATVGDTGFFGSERSAGAGPEHEDLAFHWRDVENAERRHEQEEYKKRFPDPELTRHRHRDRDDDDRSVDRLSSRDRGGGFGR